MVSRMQLLTWSLPRQRALPFAAQASSKPTLTVHSDHASKEVQELGENESYTLSVTADGANIEAPTPLGAMHALQTFLQLVAGLSAPFVAPPAIIHKNPPVPSPGAMSDYTPPFLPSRVTHA